MNLLPSLIAPVEFGGAWRLDSSYALHAGAQALASGLACFFVFFAILALQGVLLNILPATLFARVSVYVQGGLTGLFLLGGFYSWSIKEWTPETIARLPEFGAWLPPVWFAGLHQTLTGDDAAFFTSMAQRAQWAAAIALALAIVTYFISYRRYRKLLLETPVRLAASRVWRWGLIRLLARTPRREAIMDFLAKTLARSRTHRLMWLVYLGAAAAVVLNSSSDRRGPVCALQRLEQGIPIPRDLLAPGLLRRDAQRFSPRALDSGGIARQLDLPTHRKPGARGVDVGSGALRHRLRDRPDLPGPVSGCGIRLGSSGRAPPDRSATADIPFDIRSAIL